MKNRGKNKERMNRTNDFLVGGLFLITVINVFAASFTMTESPKLSGGGGGVQSSEITSETT